MDPYPNGPHNWGDVEPSGHGGPRLTHMHEKRVLLVEDHLDTQEIYRVMLEHHGFDVSVTDNGADAVRLACEEQPGLILMDIDLPILNGWEATEILRECQSTEEIPIVGLSASATSESRERASRLGFAAYITKPCSPWVVLGVAEEFCGAGTKDGETRSSTI